MAGSVATLLLLLLTTDAAPAAPAAQMLSLAAGDFCVLNSSCATSPLYPTASYENLQTCTISVAAAGYINAQFFETELDYDILTIGDVAYSGFDGPNHVAVSSGSVISWASDRSLVLPGWSICWDNRTLPPTTPSPTVLTTAISYH